MSSSVSRFACQWPKGFGEVPSKVVGFAFFDRLNGYEKPELTVIEVLEVGETVTFTTKAGQEHIITRLTDEGQDMFVLLDSVGNPDFGQNPNARMSGVATKRVKVQSLNEASAACREYIERNHLGGGNWAGGLVTDEGDIAIAEISYNGRIWPGGYTAGNKSLFKHRAVELD